MQGASDDDAVVSRSGVQAQGGRRRVRDRHRNQQFCDGAHREGKVLRMESWLAERGWNWGSFDESWFYSDSLNDLPLLSKVKHPVAVDPDATLRAHAEKQGWAVISLR